VSAKEAAETQEGWFKRQPMPLKIGLFITPIWLFAAAIYVTVFVGWLNLFCLPANEFGDFLAGVFAPIAWIWFVLAFLLQRDELILQREEIGLQREETAKLTFETKRQADLVQQNELHMRRDIVLRKLEFAIQKSVYVAADLYQALEVGNPTLRQLWDRYYGEGKKEAFEHMLVGVLEKPGNPDFLKFLAQRKANPEVLRIGQKYIDLLSPIFTEASTPAIGFEAVIEGLIQARLIRVLRRTLLE